MLGKKGCHGVIFIIYYILYILLDYHILWILCGRHHYGCDTFENIDYQMTGKYALKESR